MRPLFKVIGMFRHAAAAFFRHDLALRRGEADGKAKPAEFRRYGSARKLYTFNIDNAGAY